MKPKFKESDKVVCVDDEFDDRDDLDCVAVSALPEQGKVYVVRGYDPGLSAADGFGVYLVGIYGEVRRGTECGFRESRFRLLSEMKDRAARAEKEKARKEAATAKRKARGKRADGGKSLLVKVELSGEGVEMQFDLSALPAATRRLIEREAKSRGVPVERIIHEALLKKARDKSGQDDSPGTA